MAILTRNTTHLNLNTYFKFKNLTTLNLKKSIITSLMINASSIDLLKETLTIKFVSIKTRSTPQLTNFLINQYNPKLNKMTQTPSPLNYNLNKSRICEKFNKTFLLNNRFIKNTEHMLTTLEFTMYVLTNPLIFKIFTITSKKLNYSCFDNINKIINDRFFYSIQNNIFKSNLLPTNFFNYNIKKKILKVFSYDRLPIISFI